AIAAIWTSGKMSAVGQQHQSGCQKAWVAGLASKAADMMPTRSRSRLAGVRIRHGFLALSKEMCLTPFCVPLFQLLFGECAKRVRHGTREPQGDRSIADGFPSEALADPVDGAVCRPPRQASLAAGAACFIVEAERQFELHFRVLPEVRDGDRQQR